MDHLTYSQICLCSTLEAMNHLRQCVIQMITHHIKPESTEMENFARRGLTWTSLGMFQVYVPYSMKIYVSLSVRPYSVSTSALFARPG